jgi:hypothetical protein
MDDSTFDRLTRFLGTTPTRRDGIGLAITAALGAVASLLDSDGADARERGNGKRHGKRPTNRKGKEKWKQQHSDIGSEKKKGKGKKKKPKKPTQDQPQSPPPPDAPTWKKCIGCNVCQTCTEGEGVCRPDPSKNGLQCGGCHTCRDGACNAPADTLCPEGQRCRPSTGICCPTCQSDGSCCPVGSICIDPGPFSTNFCCDTELFDFCGGNGDGTFKSCCARDTHRCLNDQCVPRGECPDGMKLCPGGDQSFCASEDFSCCGNNACNTLNECCDAEEGLCCVKGLCAGGMCCTGNREICGNQCCDFGKVCCGSQCCSPHNCVNGQCCPRGVCGDLAGSSRVCPAEQEFCCFSGPHGSMSGYACPRGDGSQADCAPGGKCCPAGTVYNDSCDACCEDLFLLCEWNRCVPPTPGRFS